MPSNKVVFANLLLVVGSLASGMAPYSNDASTETMAPQELGSMTVDGSMVYSVNMCTIVRSTNCQVSTSTGGPAPSSGGKVQASSAETSLTPASSVPQATASGGRPTTMTRGNSSVPSTKKQVQTATESVQTQYWPSTSTSPPMPTSTGASNTVSVMRGVAVGAGAMAVAFLF